MPFAEQIAGRITGEVAGVIASDAAASASSAASATAVDASSAPAASTVRVLHIRLDPPELGPLTVRMSMKNGALDLQLEASTPETAALIERDRETISGLLRTAGYAVDGLSVQVTAAPSANAVANNGAQQQFSGQQPGGQMAGQPGHGHHGQGDGRGAAMRGNADEIAEAAASRGAGGSVYL